MNIEDIIKKCKFGNDSYKSTYNQSVMSNIPYINKNHDDICIDLQTLYNLVIKKDQTNSYGSNYKYTMPYYYNNKTNNKFIDNKFIDKFTDKQKEHFSMSSTGNIFLILVLIIVLLFVCIRNKLYVSIVS